MRPYPLRLSTLAILAGALLFTGCAALIPAKRTTDTAVKTAESVNNSSAQSFEKTVEDTKPEPRASIHIEASGTNNTVTVTPERLPEAPEVSTPSEPVVTVKRAPAGPLPAHRETVRITSGSTGVASTTEAASGFQKVSIPLGVSIALVAIGILLLVYAFRKVRQSSAAVNAAYTAADEALASQINRYRTAASTSADPLQMAQHNAAVAELEKARGKLAAQGP